MNILIILLFTISLAIADTRTINLGNQDDGTTYTITITGDFPIFNAKIIGGKKHIEHGYRYLNLVQVDVCYEENQRTPKALEYRGQQNDRTFYSYEVDFKCEQRDFSDYESMVKAQCEKPKDKNFQLICQDLEKKYGKDFITCKTGKCKDTFEWE